MTKIIGHFQRIQETDEDGTQWVETGAGVEDRHGGRRYNIMHSPYSVQSPIEPTSTTVNTGTITPPQIIGLPSFDPSLDLKCHWVGQ